MMKKNEAGSDKFGLFYASNTESELTATLLNNFDKHYMQLDGNNTFSVLKTAFHQY